MFLYSKKTASRKYIDLINQASSKWANWDPPKRIEVGDYGKVDRESGDFEWEGNVYKDKSLADLATQYPHVLAPPIDQYMVNSDQVKGCDFVLDPQLQAAGLAEATLKSQWQFGTKRGAVLIMHQPRMTHIPNEFLKLLIDVGYLKGKSLVTEVYSCSAYNMYLSNKSNETVKFALRMNVPTPPGATVGGELSAGWWSEGATGLHQHACDKKEIFIPLYALKSIRAPGLFRRDGSTDHVDVDSWDDAEVPWNNLDENGEEQEFVDTVFD